VAFDFRASCGTAAPLQLRTAATLVAATPAATRAKSGGESQSARRHRECNSATPSRAELTLACSIACSCRYRCMLSSRWLGLLGVRLPSPPNNTPHGASNLKATMLWWPVNRSACRTCCLLWRSVSLPCRPQLSREVLACVTVQVPEPLLRNARPQRSGAFGLPPQHRTHHT